MLGCKRKNRLNGRRALFRSRDGFTLIELLVALVLLNIGLLALVGLATSLGESVDRLRGGARAESIATARIERIAATSCTSASGTAHPSPDVTEWFSEQPAPNDTRLIVDSVSVIISHGIRTVVMRTRARC